MEFITLALFCALLLLCVVFNFSILYALVGGLVLFLLYGKRKGFTWRELAIINKIADPHNLPAGRELYLP